MKNNLSQYIIRLKQTNKVRKEVSERLQRKGYESIETSSFESYDGFIHCKGRTSIAETVKVVNNRGEIEILRPDVTFNVMRQLSKIYQQGDSIKLSYDSIVYEQDMKTGIVEKRQMGAEYLGEKSIDADLEVIHIAKSLLEKTERSALVIGHTQFINGLLNVIKCSETCKEEILQMLYKKQPEQLKRLLDDIVIANNIKEKIMMLLKVDLNELDDFKAGYMNDEMAIAITELQYLKEKLGNQVSFDLSLISQFDYYKGIIFKGYGKGVNQTIIRGGRYDQLSELFGVSMPAVGFSLEFDDYLKVVRSV